MNSNPLLDPAYSPEYGPDSLERVNTLPGHDLGAHEDIDPAQVAERMRAHMHDSVLREDYTTPRVHRDKAMRVREERPTSFLTGQAVVASTVPVQVAYARRERLSLTIANTGNSIVYLGATQATAQPTTGYPLMPGFQITLHTLSDVWASVGPSPLSALTYDFGDGVVVTGNMNIGLWDTGGIPNAAGVGVIIPITAVSGTTPTASFTLQGAELGTNDWVALDTADATGISSTGVRRLYSAGPVPRYLRIGVYNVTGTNPAFTLGSLNARISLNGMVPGTANGLVGILDEFHAESDGV